MFDARGPGTKLGLAVGTGQALTDSGGGGTQAWGARFSDHPSLLGAFAPSTASIATSPITDLSEYGLRRSSFCASMTQRAFDAIDRRGIMRKPSVAGCTALVMLEFLDHWNDAKRTRGGALLGAAVDHLRFLHEHPSKETEETDVAKALSGALFWIAYVSRSAILRQGDQKTDSGHVADERCSLIRLWRKTYGTVSGARRFTL